MKEHVNYSKLCTQHLNVECFSPCRCFEVFNCFTTCHKIDEDLIIDYITTLQVLKDITIENDLQLKELIYNIFKIMDGHHPKKSIIICISGSNSGKTTLMNSILSACDQDEIGTFQLPNTIFVTELD